MITIGELSLVVSLLGLIVYARQIIWGKVRPQRTTWFIWTVILGMSLVGFNAAGGGDAFWFLLGDFIVTFLVFSLSIFRGMGGWERLDIICLVIAVFGLILWQLSHQPLAVLLGVLIADMMGAIPTIKKALEEPDTESASTFLFSTIASAMGFAAVGEWNWILLFYPLYLFLANGITAQVVLVSQYQVRRLGLVKQKTKPRKAISLTA